MYSNIPITELSEIVKNTLGNNNQILIKQKQKPLTFLTVTLFGGELSASCSSHFTPEGRAWPVV
jgi:hypothetical protein